MSPSGMMVSPSLIICANLLPEGDEIIYSCFCASDDSVKAIAVMTKRIFFYADFFLELPIEILTIFGFGA